MQTSFAKHPFPCLFFLAALLLLPVVPASASRLYELNLLRQDPSFKIDSRWFSDEVIKEANSKIKSDDSHKSLFLFEIASATAQQGKLIKALEQMALIDDAKLKASPDFLEERAEIKSLLGFDSSALEDFERIEPKYQNWKTCWHRALVLQRAGKSEQAKLAFRTALAEAERFSTGDNYHTILLKTAKKQKIVALEPDPQKRDQVLSMVDSLLRYTSAPPVAESIKLLGLDEKSAETQQGGVVLLNPVSISSPIRCVTITPDGHQINVSLHSAVSGITCDIVRKHFDAATQQEVAPGAMGGCGPGTLALYPRKQESAISQFVFDGAKEPALRSFFISYKNKNPG